ncbi:MAG: hypothetical protein J7539_15015 [Niabella sp.]|nr:hypothetical protein [Niabella sp.]
MNKLILIIAFGFAIGFAGCKKDNMDFANSTGTHPDVPVTVSDVSGYYNGVPYVSTSLSGGGAITIKLNIPAGSGRSIKEITRVALGTTTSNYVVVQRTTGLYNTAAIAGNGTSATFTTTLAEYTSKTGLAVTTSGGATTFLARYFYFLITLDDGTPLIPVPVRVYVNS